ncbi:MAG: carcinine hydrolase/isopenicillin-N N-acyltransferase family protein [Flavisolibacter sp.]
MKIHHKTLLPLISLVCIVISIASCKSKIETIAFAKDNTSASDSEKTVRNFKKYKDLHVFTQFGSYDDKLEYWNNYLLSSVQKDTVVKAVKRHKKRMCSVFFTTNNTGVTYHCQNFDFPESGILVGSFNAPGKYKSVALVRMSDISYFPPNFDFTAMTDMQKSFLPFFAYYPIDGINEYGLSVSVAGTDIHNVTDTKDRKGVYITYLNRLILDNCKTVSDALALTDKYYFFDHEGLAVSNHILVADKFGNSAIIEYGKDGKLQYLVKKNENLVMTNNDVVGVEPSQISCVRYKAISKELAAQPVKTYNDCMNILSTVENKTLWSVVMDNKTGTGYIALKGKFDHFYKFDLK